MATPPEQEMDACSGWDVIISILERTLAKCDGVGGPENVVQDTFQGILKSSAASGETVVFKSLVCIINETTDDVLKSAPEPGFLIEELPKYLIIKLDWISANGDKLQKIQTSIEYPDIYDVVTYGSCTPGLKERIEKRAPGTGSNAGRRQLMAVMSHRGHGPDLSKGVHMTWIRKSASLWDRFLLFDAVEVDTSTVLKMGSVESEERPYMLIYGPKMN